MEIDPITKIIKLLADRANITSDQAFEVAERARNTAAEKLGYEVETIADNCANPSTNFLIPGGPIIQLGMLGESMMQLGQMLRSDERTEAAISERSEA